ncbi:MAG: SDR family oxidoreductase [Nostoc sp.]|uniref:SDR family oxidoreductase n=1 Tax=Nostoc sp. TaxID=1180 RepID=UPI002FF98C5D
MNTLNEQRRVALVTGANKGIGLETARQLARDHGFSVLLGARDEKRGTDAANQLRNEGLDVQFLLLDPTNPASIERARTEVEDKFGRLDVLVNNAGFVVHEDMALPVSVPTSALRDTYDLNVFAVHSVTQAFWPLLEKSDAARLVNVSSAIGSLSLVRDFEGPVKDIKLIAYASSKAALNMMTVHYAWQWRDTRHKANVLHPGNVKTDPNPNGEISVEEGAKTSVEMATIGNDGPTGQFFHLGQQLPW